MEGTSAVANPSRIAIQVDGKTDKTYYIYYGTAGKETEWNIVRNHIYRYTITAVNTAVDVHLTLEYMVMDWTNVANPDLTFGYEDGKVLESERENNSGN